MTYRSGSPSSNGAAPADPDGIVRTKIGPDRRGRLPFFLLLSFLLLAAGVALLLLMLLVRRGAGGPKAHTLTSSRTSETTSPGPRRAPTTPHVNNSYPSPLASGTPVDADEDGAPESPPPVAGTAREGIYAFPAPGTKRIKVGIVVPDDFELPPGYVRHYQATDKGEMLPAILMFHPLTPPLDARGEPVEVPADRIVPADMAPPGLPIEMLRVPENAYADPNDPGPIPADVNHQGAGDSTP